MPLWFTSIPHYMDNGAVICRSVEVIGSLITHIYGFSSARIPLIIWLSAHWRLYCTNAIIHVWLRSSLVGNIYLCNQVMYNMRKCFSFKPILAWINHYVCIKLCDVLTHLCPYHNSSFWVICGLVNDACIHEYIPQNALQYNNLFMAFSLLNYELNGASVISLFRKLNFFQSELFGRKLNIWIWK